MYLSIGQASQMLGVSISTLRRWEVEKRLLPSYRTKGGHRRYCIQFLKTEVLEITDDSKKSDNRTTICYSRVSSADQKLDLVRQSQRLSKHCNEQGWKHEVISDLGSGLNYKKKGLNKLIHLICTNQISRIVLVNKDRLLRFGTPLLFKICEYFNTEIVILEEQQLVSFEKELVADVIAVMTVFTAKMHGKRSHRNKKKLAA